MKENRIKIKDLQSIIYFKNTKKIKLFESHKDNAFKQFTL